MSGWLITNKYLNGSKFDILKQSFLLEAKNVDIDLEYFNNEEASKNLDNNIYPDFVIYFDKDIYLGKRIEQLNIKMYNKTNSIAICDDKAKTYLALKKHNIRQPFTIISPFSYGKSLIEDKEYISYIEKTFTYPFIIKECFGSFGEQVFLIENKNQLLNIINQINGKSFIVQEFIKNSFGKDIRVEVVNNKVLCAIKRINKNGDFRANITNGAEAEKYELSDKQIELAVDVCKILNLNFAGVDILFGDNDEPILCEVNSNAHIDNISKICSVNVTKEILLYIKKDINNEL